MRSWAERKKRIDVEIKGLLDSGVKLKRVKRPELKIGVQLMIDGGRRKYGKRFFYPALDTMVILLARRQHILTSLRTLSRAIRELVDEMVVYRKNRHIRGKGIKMTCRTTVYYLLDKGREVFRKMLRQAQRFLLPLGVPKVASDNVTRNSVFNELSARISLQGTFTPFKEVASLH